MVSQDLIRITSENVKRLTIDLAKLPIPTTNKEFKIIHNNNLSSTLKLTGRDTQLSIDIPVDNNGTVSEEYSPFVNGPINKIFLDRFAVVKSKDNSKNTEMIMSTLDSLWKFEYLTGIPTIDESSISSGGSAKFGRIYIIDKLQEMNKNILEAAGIELNNSFYTIGDKQIHNNNFSFAFISKNADNSNCDLYIGSNNGKIAKKMLAGIIRNGWYDFEIWDNKFNKPIVQSRYLDKVSVL